MSAPTVATGFTNATAIAYSANRHVAVVGDRTGRLTLLDLRRRLNDGYPPSLIGEGYGAIDHLAYDDVSDRLIVADGNGVWVTRLTNADQADATAVSRSSVDVRALGTAFVAGAPVALVLVGGPTPHLDAYHLGADPGGTVDPLVTSLAGATSAAVADSTSAFLLTAATAGTILQLADWSTSTVSQMSRDTLPFGGFVASLDSQWALVVSERGEFACVRRDGALSRPTAAGSAARVTAVAVTEDRHVLMATDDSVLEDTLPRRSDLADLREGHGVGS